MVVTERLDLVWRMLFMFGYDRTLSLAPRLFESIPQHDTSPVRFDQFDTSSSMRPDVRALIEP